MKYNNKFKSLALISVAAGLFFANPLQAATAISGTFFDKNNTSADMTVRAYSWYNLSMGYLGWTHHSNWGFVKLKKGKPITIELTTEVSGLHPSITVWYRAGAKNPKTLPYMNGHAYKQFGDIYEPNAEATDAENNPVKVGNIIMKFITNGFDRDGMGDALPAEYDQSQLYRVMDGVPGKLAITFTPPENGWYQFVVGAINPDIDSTAYGSGPGSGAGPATAHTVHIEVSIP
ncbi:copper(I)-binding protein CorA [Methylomicrobium agile]|uniref:copper(I)-binding protein CorA n=1 Tax=Methylomicrobium agile TaxID=39774 RepID=UPI0012F67E21|nr:copper(I)-binding protein CorA [Methylomicrobium agile]